MEEEDINMIFIIFAIVLYLKVKTILMDPRKNIIIHKREK